VLVPLLLDVHVPVAIAGQLRRRGVDVLTAADDGSATLPDPDLLERARALGRIVFTQDIGFKALAEDWQRSGRPFLGLVFGHQLGATIGRYVVDLELIALATDPGDWSGTIEHLPFQP